MEHYYALIVAALIIFAGIAVAVIFFKKRQPVKATSEEAEITVAEEPCPPAVTDEAGDLLTIDIEQLAITSPLEENRLCEIKDKSVIARITQTIPSVAQTTANSVAKSILKETVNNPQMFIVKIPSGTSLVNETKKGIQYAFYKGGKGGSAQLVKPDMSQMTKATSLASGVANVMNIGSLVVGQYYMSEINNRLETMTKSIDRIGDFQEREFKSRILSVIALVGEISEFSTEIIEDDEQRNRKLMALEDLKATATELLGQVNITIKETTSKTPKPDYAEYQTMVSDFKKLAEYQNTLVATLEEISKLTYLLGKGFISMESSYSVFNKYLNQSAQVRNTLIGWHDKQVKSLQIDLEGERIEKSGIEAVVSAIPAWLIDAKYKSKDLKDGLADDINRQAQALPEKPSDQKKVYDEDVEIVIKDGKCFYLR